MENKHPYLPHTRADIEHMLARCGMATLADLYADVPDALRLREPYRLDRHKSEPEVRRYFSDLCSRNRTLTCFAGGGWYDHACPAAVTALTQRSEFLTAYTPYQPEISQGTLQYIFEYQTMMARLTGMYVSNASMYDGSTATAEAALMAVSAGRRKRRVAVSGTLLPHVAEVVATYCHYHGIDLTILPEADGGVTSREALTQALAGGDVAGVIVASPNRYGILEDYTGWADEIHAAKSLLIINSHAAALSVIRTPGEWGADIAVGEAQSLGMPLSYGGPGLGYMCCTKALIRKLPGRIVGATTDAVGQRTFVLTLQAREQHIRREKATSNICSNQGLMALHAAIYLSLTGAEGLRRISLAGASGIRRLAGMLEATGRMQRTWPESPVLNEMLMTTDFDVDQLLERGAAEGLLCGVKVDSTHLLIAVTEMQTLSDMERYAALVGSMPKR